MLILMGGSAGFSDAAKVKSDTELDDGITFFADENKKALWKPTVPLELVIRIELMTSSLPRMCSTD